MDQFSVRRVILQVIFASLENGSELNQNQCYQLCNHCPCNCAWNKTGAEKAKYIRSKNKWKNKGKAKPDKDQQAFKQSILELNIFFATVETQTQCSHYILWHILLGSAAILPRAQRLLKWSTLLMACGAWGHMEQTFMTQLLLISRKYLLT